MSGRSRLPSGEPRRASQRRTRPAAQKAAEIEAPWHAGDRVRWRDRPGAIAATSATGSMSRSSSTNAPIASAARAAARVKLEAVAKRRAGRGSE